MKFSLKAVLLEGPDCAGKTTAYRSIHKHTKFKWNVHDRSTLSMLCYAIHYKRDTYHWRQQLQEELNDLNNMMVVFLPPLRIILERLKARGDEYQTVDSIVRLYEIFEQEAMKIKDYPNVIVYRALSEDYSDLTKLIMDYEAKTYDSLADTIARHVDASDKDEQINLRFAWTDNNFKQIDETRLVFEKEAEYYSTTKMVLIKKIRNEFEGLNEYCKPQSEKSRRFVLAQDTCISFVQALYRNDTIHLNVVCRSSEVEETFKHDIHFIGELGRIVKSELGVFADNVHYTVTLGSAHIRI